MSATPALDFCQRVRTWQDSDGASSGLPLLVPSRELSDLDTILTSVQVSGPSPLLEDRARRWLISYRELVRQQGGLTREQEDELNSVVDQLRAPYQARAGDLNQRRRPSVPHAVIAILAVIIIVVTAGLSISALLIGSADGSPPPAGPVAAQPAGPQPGALTDLQRFRADWHVPAAATADAGNARQLVLLQDGLYYPAPWEIPAGDPGWVANTSGSITAANVNQAASTADVTDADGTTWTVAIGQPFVLASDPSVVFRILRDGTIQSMPQPHAIVVRTGA